MSLIDYFRKTDDGITKTQAKELIAEIRSMRSRFTNGGRVTFSEMEKIPFATDETTFFEPADGIKCYRLAIPEPGIILFWVVMDPGSSFGTHDHNCIEWTWVVAGVANVDGIDEVPMKMLSFPAFTEHTFRSPQGCHMVVAFRNTKQ